MAERPTPDSEQSLAVDPRSGFCRATGTFRSLRQKVPLPSETLPLSYTAHAFSLLPSPLPTKPALVDAVTSSSLSYAELVSRVRSLTSAFRHELGVSKGDVAFVLSPTRLEVPTLYLALFSAGAVVAAANPLSTSDELAYQIGLASPSFCFSTSELAVKLAPFPDHPIVIIDSSKFQSMMIRKVEGSDNPCNDLVEIRQSDPAAIQFSSGTTGRVKAVSVSHRSLIAQVSGFHALRSPKEARFPAKTLLLAPMFHTMGFLMVLKGVAMGETTVVTAGRLSIEQMIEVAARFRVSQIITAPPVVVAMSSAEAAVRFDLSALERVFCGGAPLPEQVALRFVGRFPHVKIIQGLGLTEGGGIARMVGDEESVRFRSVGRLSEHVEAKVVDMDSGREMPPGNNKAGELWIRGPATMLGYVGDPEATSSAFAPGGWLRTGDVCYFDADGFLYVVDRAKEMIKYKAYQVAPADLERILQKHNKVEDVAVIPHPHEEAGQIPMACVVKKKGSKLTEEELIEFVEKRVSPYKKVRKVVFVDSIPRSPAGKILRREMIADFKTSNTSKL